MRVDCMRFTADAHAGNIAKICKFKIVPATLGTMWVCRGQTHNDTDDKSRQKIYEQVRI